MLLFCERVLAPDVRSFGRKGKNGKENSLLAKVKRDSKVLPALLLDGRRPDLLVLPVKDLVGVLGETVLAQDGAGLEVELVGRVVGGFVPDVLFGVIPLSQPSFFLSSRTSSRNDSQYTRAKDSVASADRP